MSAEERALLIRYLAIRLFDQPMNHEQEEEFADLLSHDKDHEWVIEKDEKNRFKELVRMLIRGAELEPEEEKELFYLHRKQNKGIGNLTPAQW